MNKRNFIKIMSAVLLLTGTFSICGCTAIQKTVEMENIIYNELNIRQFSVDVGVVYARTLNENGSSVRTPREIDFIVNSGGKRTYIQSAYAMPDDEKAEAELRPFKLTGDSFPKMVIARTKHPKYSYEGIEIYDIADWLLQE